MLMKMPLSVVTFNIRCFGFNGDYFAVGRSETRLTYLKEFILEQALDSDVIILQEIMDLSLLNQILPEGYKFYHYAHEYPRHMHLVLCCKEEFDFEDIQTIPGTSLDETTSRPALYGRLTKEGQSLAQVIGVHLKSSYEHTENRIKQVKAISKFIEESAIDLPLIIGGDFNSHEKTKTKKERNDISYINEVFKPHGLVRVPNSAKTYVTIHETAHLDHIWTDAIVDELLLYPLPKESYLIKQYFNQISDHLPLKVKLKL